jgi:MFS transporter, ACS family, tartrate transporter
MEEQGQGSVFAKATWRLVPFIMVLYVVAYLDRVNISAASLTMNKDLGLTAWAYGFGSGIFFLGYFLFEVPSNVILEKIGARLWIGRIMLTWGVVSMADAFVTGPWSFFTVRFLLGLAEAGFFPGLVFYLTTWFPSGVRARFVALFLAAVPLTNVIGTPISGLILGMDGFWHLHGWQWLFLIEGAPSLILGTLVLLWLPNGPADARWLTDDDRAALAAAMADEPEQTHKTLLPMFLDTRVWVLSGIYFGAVIAQYGVNFWLPQIVHEMGFTILQSTFIAAIPYFVTMFAMVLWSRHSDRRRERIWHIALPAILGAAGLVGAAFFHAPFAVLLSMSLALIGAYAAVSVFWTLPPAFLSGTAAAAGIALINSIGNLGGFFGPNIMGWLRGETGSYSAGLGVLALGMLLAAVLVFFVGRTLTFAGRAQALERYTKLNA